MSDTSTMRYRWIDGPTASDEEWDFIDKLLEIGGYISLNRATSRVLIAEDHNGVAGFHVFQMIPYSGPLWLRPSARGSGLAKKLTDDMLAFLAEAQVRGFLVIADSPHSAKICREHGMVEINSPTFVMGGKG